ncbi:hypothetical protein [Nostoc sp.]
MTLKFINPKPPNLDIGCDGVPALSGGIASQALPIILLKSPLPARQF